MKEKIMNSILNLLSIKSIIALSISIVFIILARTNQLPVESITMIMGMVFTYYFGKGNDEHHTG